MIAIRTSTRRASDRAGTHRHRQLHPCMLACTTCVHAYMHANLQVQQRRLVRAAPAE